MMSSHAFLIFSGVGIRQCDKWLPRWVYHWCWA